MNKIIKLSLLGLLSLSLMLGMSGGANATTTVGVNSITNDGVLTITAAGASVWSTSTGALTVTARAASTWSTYAGKLIIEAGSTTADILNLVSDKNVANAIDIDATAGGVDIDAVMASVFTVTGTDNAHDLTLETAGGDFSDIVINSGDDLDIDAADDITMNTAGGAITVTSVGGIIKLDATSTPNEIQLATGTADVKITGGNSTDALTVAAGDAVITLGSFTITGDDDDAATLSVTNNTATSESPFVFVGSGAFTGTTTKSWLTLTAAGLTTGTQVYGIAAALTQGKMLHLVSGATQTTGANLYVQNTGANSAMTSGEVATFNHTATGIASSVNKIGNVVSVSSARTVTTSGTTADDFDLLSLTKATTQSAGTAGTTGSVLNIALQTTGTVTETSKGIELLMDSGGTGDGIEITHLATGAVALDVHGAATTVSDVLISGTGAKNDNKAVLEVSSVGNTADGGAVLRVVHAGTGDPAHANAYLADFDYTAATLAAHSTAVRIAQCDTGAALLVTSSGVAGSGHLVVQSTNAAGVGAVINFDQTAASAAVDDVTGRILFTAQDDANAAESYARIDSVIADATGANPDGDLRFYVDRAGTLKQGLSVGWDDTANAAVNGIMVGDAAAAGIVSSNGAQSLTLNTNGGTNSGTITIVAGANGDITIAPNGVGFTDINNLVIGGPVVTATAGAFTYTAVQLCGSVIKHDPNIGGAGNVAGTTDTAANLIAACVPAAGDTHMVLLKNLADAAETITITANAGGHIVLLEPDGHNVVIGQNNWARIIFTNLDGTDVIVSVDELTDAD